MKMVFVRLLMTVIAFSAFTFGSFAVHVDVEPSDVSVSADFAASFKVMPTDSVGAFLASHGIDTGLADRRAIAVAVSSLSGADSSDADLWDTAWNELTYLVNQALFSALYEGYEPVFMDIAGIRWTLHRSLPE